MFFVKLILDLVDFTFEFVRKYILEIIMLMFITLFVVWLTTYIANGYFGYRFELNSCWNGFGAIGGAGFLAAVRYCMDSWHNSPKGMAPVEHEPIKEIISTLNKAMYGNRQRGERNNGQS